MSGTLAKLRVLVTPNARDLLNARVEALARTLSRNLQAWVAEQEVQTWDDADDEDFQNHADAAQAAIRSRSGVC